MAVPGALKNPVLTPGLGKATTVKRERGLTWRHFSRWPFFSSLSLPFCRLLILGSLPDSPLVFAPLAQEVA
jgi:hypothetical protein